MVDGKVWEVKSTNWLLGYREQPMKSLKPPSPVIWTQVKDELLEVLLDYLGPQIV